MSEQIIEIIGRELFIDGNTAGSVEDAVSNFPNLSGEVWKLMVDRNNQHQEVDTVLFNTNEELSTVKARLTESNTALYTVSINLKEKEELLAAATASLQERETQLAAVSLELTELKASLEVVPNPRVITATEFMNKFTDAQIAEIASKAQTDVNLSVFLIKLSTTQSVNLDSPDTIAGLNYLLSLGIDVQL